MCGLQLVPRGGLPVRAGEVRPLPGRLYERTGAVPAEDGETGGHQRGVEPHTIDLRIRSMDMSTADFPGHTRIEADRYTHYKWWLGLTLGDVLDRTADVFPSRIAVVRRLGETYLQPAEGKGRQAGGRSHKARASKRVTASCCSSPTGTSMSVPILPSRR